MTFDVSMSTPVYLLCSQCNKKFLLSMRVRQDNKDYCSQRCKKAAEAIKGVELISLSSDKSPKNPLQNRVQPHSKDTCIIF